MKLSVRHFWKSFRRSNRPSPEHVQDFLRRAKQAGLVAWDPASERQWNGECRATEFVVLPREVKP